jgi:hypothetical protein
MRGLTVADLQRDREARARVNHETYKQLLRQVQDRIRARSQNKATAIAWQVPPFVPGRPVYTVSHASRYVSEKLRRGGFEVSVAAPQADVHMLFVSWSARAPSPRKATRPVHLVGHGERRPRAERHRANPPAGPPISSMDNASRALDKLKARLRLTS